MILDELTKFCDLNGYSSMTIRPFSYGNYTYATDSRVMVRVPRIEGVSNLSTKEAEGFGKIILDFNNKIEEWFPITKVESVEQVCSNCDGTGELYSCPECNGYGSVELSNDFNDYGKQDCKTCKGYGAIKNKLQVPPWVKTLQKEACEECGSTGIEIDKNKFTEMGGKKFYTYVIYKIQNLPEIEFGVVGEDKPCIFRFNYGEGITVPVKDNF